MAITSRLSFFVALSLSLGAAGPAWGQEKVTLDQFLDKLAAKNKAMGSLAIAKDGKVVYARAMGYGKVDGASKIPLTSASRFRIGSITKTFTAAMILQLAEEGKLKLTDTLDQYAPQMPNAKQITLAHLLTHRSGLPNVRREPVGGKNVNTEPISRDEMLALIAKSKPDFSPDSQFRYSNSGYQLLGQVLEKVTGQSFAKNLETRITAKLGLKDTYVATGPIDASKNEALTYFHVGGEWKTIPETHPSILYSAGAIVSTPADLAKFIQALFDGKVVSQESLGRMTTVRDGFGMGLEQFTFGGKTFYGHAGGADNYGAWLAYQPEDKLAVAYCTNAKIYPVVNIVRGVADLHYGRPFTMPALESVAVSPDILDTYVGTYSHPDAPAKAAITRDGATLYFRPPGSTTAAPLEAVSETKFQIEGAVTFEFDAAKRTVVVKRRGGERVFTKDQ
jgi:D-alanyl-D-alanine carboxypeptidase